MKYLHCLNTLKKTTHVYYECEKISELTGGRTNDFWTLDFNKKVGTGSVIFPYKYMSKDHILFKLYVL